MTAAWHNKFIQLIKAIFVCIFYKAGRQQCQNKVPDTLVYIIHCNLAVTSL